jgi:hypothetical protein
MALWWQWSAQQSRDRGRTDCDFQVARRVGKWVISMAAQSLSQLRRSAHHSLIDWAEDETRAEMKRARIAPSTQFRIGVLAAVIYLLITSTSTR